MGKLKYFLCTVLLLSFCYCESASSARQAFVHPIDARESACKTEAKTLDEWTRCTLKAANAWTGEVDKYYSLLYKKFPDNAKQTLYDDQKYWNMYKNKEYGVLDALQDKDNETKERVMFRATQKRDLIKNRAQSLRMYYVQTFPDDEQEKIQINNDQSGFQLDPVLQRSLRWLGF